MGWGRGLGHSRRHRPQEADLTPTSVPPKAPAAGVSQPGRGTGGTLTRQTRASRGSCPAAGWASPPGRGQRLPLAGRGGRGTGTRCSWRRRGDCWRPNHLTGPLGESQGTTCFWERSVGCPPGGQLNRLSGVVSGASAKRPRRHGCWKPSRGVAAGGRDGREESARNHGEMRDQEPEQLMEAGKLNAQQAGPAPGCKLYGRACSEPRHPPRCREGAADSVRLCCSEPPPSFWNDPEKAGQRH